jgi:hypothetical protein
MLGQALAHRVHHGVGGIAGLHKLELLVVFGGIELGVLDHLLDLVFREAAAFGEVDGAGKSHNLRSRRANARLGTQVAAKRQLHSFLLGIQLEVL